jgi:hypothetical protein
MFGIHWYSGTLLIERQTSAQTFLAEVVAAMRVEATEVGVRHPSNTPDAFRVYDCLGREMGQYTLR